MPGWILDWLVVPSMFLVLYWLGYHQGRWVERERRKEEAR